MNCASAARKLADYIDGLDSFIVSNQNDNGYHYTHIGALFTDIILQAGLNYSTVVKPRVQKILLEFPEANTCLKFQKLIDLKGLPELLNWNHHIKLQRIKTLLNFCLENNIDTCSELKLFLVKPSNREALLAPAGFGPKTLDYLMKLLNFDTVAVDRHIYSFVEMAEIPSKNYQQTKKIVEHAADFLHVSRATIDQSIWLYMSKKQVANNSKVNQLDFVF